MKAQYLLVPVLCTFLVGCLQEDPQLQALRDEKDGALARIAGLEEELKVAKSGGQSQGPAYEKEIENLKEQLEMAQAEAKKAKENMPEILSDEERLIRLEVATAEHRKAIREKFDVVKTVVADSSITEKVTHPYRHSVQYDLIEKATGDPYHLDVNILAPLSGEWKIPPIAEFPDKIRKGPRVAESPDTDKWDIRIERVESLPKGSGSGGSPSQTVNGPSKDGGQNVVNGQKDGNPQQSNPVPPESDPIGPGMGPVTKRITVDWK